MIDKMLYVTIEGIDGSGKTTVTTRLVDSLKQEGYRVGYFTMLPYNKLREVVLWDKELTPLQRATLYKVGAETTRLKMLESAAEFDIAFVERGVDTFIAYQGFGDELRSEVSTLLSLYPEFPIPDKTIYLDVPIHLAYKRTHLRGEALDHFEQKEEAFFTRVKEGFEHRQEVDQMRAKELDCEARIVRIDGTLDQNTVYHYAYHNVKRLLTKEGKNPSAV
jgi:dTMP kinase